MKETGNQEGKNNLIIFHIAMMICDIFNTMNTYSFSSLNNLTNYSLY